MMHINYIGSFCLIVLGMYCMIAKKDMMRTCIGMGMTDYGQPADRFGGLP